LSFPSIAPIGLHRSAGHHRVAAVAARPRGATSAGTRLWHARRMSVSVPTRSALDSVQVTAPLLRRALISGFRRVIEQREALDRINVFPVADGDTGSNLAFTLRSVLAGSLSRSSASAGRLLRQVADDAIDGARGNSGAIL